MIKVKKNTIITKGNLKEQITDFGILAEYLYKESAKVIGKDNAKAMLVNVLARAIRGWRNGKITSGGN